MSSLVPSLAAPSDYRDRRYKGTDEDYWRAVAESTTLYVGNLSFFTTEEQIYELFSKCGDIKRIIMGLDSHQRTPCGFCFVEYYKRTDALDVMKFINGTKLDERPIRIDMDPGFEEGRQFGRGRSGGQVRDEYREEYDPGRGGWGPILRRQQELVRGEQQKDTYQSYAIPLGPTSEYYVKDAVRNAKRDRDEGFDTNEDTSSTVNLAKRITRDRIREPDVNPRFRGEDKDDE
ncbi:hypothetical protein SmJEL517_g01667 [Synchytrium microbalum]|uniref:Nuclear cap-binding protein subunit 2 n=1 Tax=Synchytrium microbalum TaxID=1806994 RepID=A0A507CEA9_9FUNG|nr:uncharacterized protein SmJEL517_g01667 [Synchytrium microbalum]TPX36264.1 hypothetical protein SmJEL517_g01667 [Synchytrium microbalum]